eukprot:363227-Chlamydomonas_euryale.AAC.9
MGASMRPSAATRRTADVEEPTTKLARGAVSPQQQGTAGNVGDEAAAVLQHWWACRMEPAGGIKYPLHPPEPSPFARLRGARLRGVGKVRTRGPDGVSRGVGREKERP